jgi:hypothetical protein
MNAEMTNAYILFHFDGIGQGVSPLSDEEADDLKRDIKIRCKFYMETYYDRDDEGEVSAIDLPEEVNQ